MSLSPRGVKVAAFGLAVLVDLVTLAKYAGPIFLANANGGWIFAFVSCSLIALVLLAGFIADAKNAFTTLRDDVDNLKKQRNSDLEVEEEKLQRRTILAQRWEQEKIGITDRLTEVEKKLPK